MILPAFARNQLLLDISCDVAAIYPTCMRGLRVVYRYGAVNHRVDRFVNVSRI